MSLAASLEAAAEAMPAAADAIRDANGDAYQLLSTLDADVSARVLTWMLSNDAEAAAELADGWAEDERGTERLLAIQASDLPKAGRKVLRRVLHRLRSQGITVPTPAAGESRVARLPDVEDDLSAAYVTALDPRGARLAFIVESNPSGGARLFEALLDDVNGIVDFQVYNAGRSRVRNFVKDAIRRAGPQAIQLDAAAAKVLIARGAAAHPGDRPLPRAFAEWKTHLAAPEGSLAPGELIAQELGGAEPTLAEQSRVAELIREGAIGPWPPDRETLGKIAESVSGEEESKLVLSAEAREARVDAAVEAASKQIFEPTHAERTALRFAETAFVLNAVGREEDARACLAAASDFRGDNPAECSTARTMVETLLAPLFESMRQEKESDEGDASSVVES